MFNTFRLYSFAAAVDGHTSDRPLNTPPIHEQARQTHPMAPVTKPFATYLLPSIPFFRRRTSSTSAESTSPPTTPSAYASAPHTTYLQCASCGADLCLSSQIISKGFTGRHGRAYLVRPHVSPAPPSPGAVLPNTSTGPPVPRQLVTGAHTVSDIACTGCRSVLGWKYVAAEEEAQRYKVGMCILETRRVCGAVHVSEDNDRGKGEWVDEDECEDVEFDSQDEDECEDLFAGLWSPKMAAVRRKQNKALKRNGSTDFSY
ncbi:MAG: hypothetical protein M1814_002317 [Vezdaea aestivalis]|nr:MAG: hypothetical protein M1814_002317 [Vezdaea aestivalis]